MQSFTSAGADTSLNVDDADFWSKLMPGMQSARGLMSRLNDGAATRDEESKATFIDELSQLVKDILEAKRNEEDVSSHEWDTTKQMVLQTSCMKSSFSDEECTQAAHWLESMECYEGRRNRGARMSNVNNRRGRGGGSGRPCIGGKRVPIVFLLVVVGAPTRLLLLIPLGILIPLIILILIRLIFSRVVFVRFRFIRVHLLVVFFVLDVLQRHLIGFFRYLITIVVKQNFLFFCFCCFRGKAIETGGEEGHLLLSVLRLFSSSRDGL